ncbi:MAG: hypothetical protein SGILL_007809 [Bacillariaceae sp.]
MTQYQHDSMLSSSVLSPARNGMFSSRLQLQPFARQISTSSSPKMECHPSQQSNGFEQRKARAIQTCVKALDIVEGTTSAEIAFEPLPLSSAVPPTSILIPNAISLDTESEIKRDMFEPIDCSGRFHCGVSEDDEDTGSMGTIDGQDLFQVLDDSDDISEIFE